MDDPQAPAVAGLDRDHKASAALRHVALLQGLREIGRSKNIFQGGADAIFQASYARAQHPDLRPGGSRQIAIGLKTTGEQALKLGFHRNGTGHRPEQRYSLRAQKKPLSKLGKGHKCVTDILQVHPVQHGTGSGPPHHPGHVPDRAYRGLLVLGQQDPHFLHAGVATTDRGGAVRQVGLHSGRCARKRTAVPGQAGKKHRPIQRFQGTSRQIHSKNRACRSRGGGAPSSGGAWAVQAPGEAQARPQRAKVAGITRTRKGFVHDSICILRLTRGPFPVKEVPLTEVAWAGSRT